ncbi:MAG TPA: lipopolysaccharide transport periplasmic protein LptA [Xanthomonadaceae bacterium]|nr:lipopolysaccharide transport periplasmic protein LptA [Xanthomonadaceae bacterium]
MYPRRKTDRIAGRIALALLLGLLCAGAWAKKSDRLQPMDAHADHLDGNLADDGISTLTGNVIMTQGTLEIRSDKAVITRKDGDMSYVVLTGNPVHMKELDENDEPVYGTSQRVDYDLDKSIAILTVNAIVNQPTRGQMHGEKIVYDVNNNTVTSGNDGTRVFMHMLAKPKPGQPATPPKAESPPPDLPSDQPAGKTP